MLSEAEFWNEPGDLKLIPTRGSLGKDNVLAVPAEWETRFPGLGLRLGQVIRAKSAYNKKSGLFEYGLLLSPQWPKSSLGMFQVDNDDLTLRSGIDLHFWKRAHPGLKVVLHPKAEQLLHTVLRVWELHDANNLSQGHENQGRSGESRGSN